MSVVGITNMDLLCHRCPCGELCVDGFFHQLVERRSERRKYRMAVESPPCHNCGLVHVRRVRLTAGRNRGRLIPWNWIRRVALRFLPVPRSLTVCWWTYRAERVVRL